jgi:hypothetical protein
VSTFFYAIEKRSNLTEADFPKKPMVMLQNLKEILGEAGFEVLEKPIVVEISETFGIEKSKSQGSLDQIVAIARNNFLYTSLMEKQSPDR